MFMMEIRTPESAAGLTTDEKAIIQAYQQATPYRQQLVIRFAKLLNVVPDTELLPIASNAGNMTDAQISEELDRLGAGI